MASPTLGDRPLLSTALSLAGRRVGKVRDIYDLPGGSSEPGRLLIVATDRLSAFDVVLPTGLAGKGRILTSMAVFWMRFVEARGMCRTHLLSTDVGEVPASAFEGRGESGGASACSREDLRGRVMITRRCRVIPVECVVRGYLEGSGWKDYQRTGAVCGVELPRGLEQCARLPQPIFTPATKEDVGTHDVNISLDEGVAHLARRGWNQPQRLMQRLRALSLAIYQAASAHALARGIIIADTKFEFGVPADAGRVAGGAGEPGAGGAGDAWVEPILIDEALTPDSSRFWPADGYEPGRAQQSFDKQFVREYLEGLVAAGRWNKAAPGPDLPAEVVQSTLERYRAAREMLTGERD